MTKLFSEEQKKKVRTLGAHGLMIKMAAYDGYSTPESFSPEKRLLSVLGQKYFTKKASMKTIKMGIGAISVVNGE